MTKQSNLKQTTYNKIKQKLLWGELPQGAPLREVQLAQELEVSRTPVREAIAQLERDGLVECKTGRSCVVKTFSKKELHDIYELREFLEYFALQKSIKVISTTQIEKMEFCCNTIKKISKSLKKTMTQNDFKNLVKENDAVDMSFHLELLLSTDNKYVSKMIADLNIFSIVCLSNMQPKQYEYTEFKESLLADYEFHSEFLEAIKAKDIDKACKMSSSHMQAAYHETIKGMNANNEDKEQGYTNWQNQANKTLEILQNI